MYCDFLLERETGIEPAFSAWEADVLPLNHTRNHLKADPKQPYLQKRSSTPKSGASLGDAYGIRTHECQRERLVSSAASPTRHNGEPSAIRTPDTLIKSQVLCRLS